MKTPEVSRKLSDMGLIAVGSAPAEFAQFIRSQREMAGRLVKQAGIPQQ